MITFMMLPNIVFAYSDKVIVGGETIGIEIKADGILVVGTYSVDNEVIAAESGIRPGDVITSAKEFKVSSISDLMNSIDENTCSSLDIAFIRDNKKYDTTLTLKKENNICKTGLYVKDSVTGIGTLTFIDPETKIFGALGHEIIEKSTGKLLDTKKGTIFNSEVINVEKSSNGTPGEKTARYYTNQVNGTVFKNTNKGIFGAYAKELNTDRLYTVAKKDDVKKGPAKILTVLKGNEIKEYAINIIKISDKQDTKNIVFEITDEELLEKAGGIVQGMSGSPIVQGEYIVGAVTHVVVETPTKGYGIFITNMLEEGER